jgi:acyl-homoserine lactone acylase PvdQ
VRCGTGGGVFTRPRLVVLATCAAALVCAAPAQAAKLDYGKTVRNVLPPGQYGAQQQTTNSTDQVPLYDGLTPLGSNVTLADIARLYKSARFNQPKGGEITRPRPGVTIRTDSYGVPHIRGRRRDDVMFGAGWVTARDRQTLIERIRGPSRLTALDAPGANAFGIATSLSSSFEPSAEAERFLNSQIRLFTKGKGRVFRKRRRVLRDVNQYVAGINAYYDENDVDAPRWTRRDVLACASLFGARFGAGGGREVLSSEILAQLQDRLGAAPGERVWRDLRSANDPETPATLGKQFRYSLSTSASAPGSAVIDVGSQSAAAARAARVDAAMRRPMSNALLVGRRRSDSGRPIAVMGPQVGHAYPGLLMELDLHGGGIDARGAAFPSVSLYVLLGRAKDYAWSATSSSSDNIDQYLEELCNPDGSPATAQSTHYLYKGDCRPLRTVFAGTLKQLNQPDQRIEFPQSVHGPVSGTVTVDGKPYAVASKRSTYGRDALNAVAFADLNANKVRSARDFARVMNQVEFSFNWHYIDNRDIAFFSSGRIPIRAKGVNPSLPTLGTGQYEWRGFLSRKRHPQVINPKSGLLLNWNNKPARGFDAADDNWSYTPTHRVDMFSGIDRDVTLSELVGVMNRAATQDLRALEVWPLIAEVLAGGPAPNPLSQGAADQVTAWVGAGASRLDVDLDGSIDHPGAAVLDAAWPRIAETVLEPVVGPAAEEDGLLRRMMGPDGRPENGSSAYGGGWYGYINKDLRALLGKPVRGAYGQGFCGAGNLEACRTDLWEAVRAAATEVAATQGLDPSAWREPATPERIVFGPLLPGVSMRYSNRPTFQQVLEFKGHRPRGKKRKRKRGRN